MKGIIFKKCIVIIILLYLNIGIHGMENENPNKQKKHTILQSKEKSKCFWCQCKNTPSKNETIALKKNTNILNENMTDWSQRWSQMNDENKVMFLNEEKDKNEEWTINKMKLFMNNPKQSAIFMRYVQDRFARWDARVASHMGSKGLTYLRNHSGTELPDTVNGNTLPSQFGYPNRDNSLSSQMSKEVHTIHAKVDPSLQEGTTLLFQKKINDLLIEFLINENDNKDTTLHFAPGKAHDEVIVNLLLDAFNEKENKKLIEYVMKKDDKKNNSIFTYCF